MTTVSPAGDPTGRPRSLLVIGTGLIGTSVALAAQRAGWAVHLADRDPAREQAARAILDQAGLPVRVGPTALSAQTLPAEQPGPAQTERAQTEPALTEPSVDEELALRVVELVCVAVGPDDTASVVAGALGTYLHATVMDVCSVKAEPQQQVEASGADTTRYVGSHPLAGSERSGPAAARSDLFRGRSWVVCGRPGLAAERLAVVEHLIRDCRAHPVHLDAQAHDRLLAVTSHLPQLLASSLSALVAETFGAEAAAAAAAGPSVPTPEVHPVEEAVAPSSLAGPALLDMTRVAASPSQMWAEIAAANTAPVRAAVAALISRLEHVRDGLEAPAAAASTVRALVDEGREARQRMGLKHAGTAPPAVPASPASTALKPEPQPECRPGPVPAAVPARPSAVGWVWVDTVVDDTPGTLARVFAAAARVAVNVEDVRVDHAPYAAAGVVSVAVSDEAAARRLTAELRRPA